MAPALPALVLLYFYRFGMGLYLVFSGDAATPLGFPDHTARAATWVVSAFAYLPLAILIYTPFLPLQDALLRGERRSFFDGVKRVLELVAPFGISSLLQALIIALPAFAVVFGAALAALSIGGPATPARSILILFAMIPAVGWIAIALFFLCFAAPLLVLDGRGPIQSIRESFSITRRHAGALVGRYFAAMVVLAFALIFASFPSAMLNVLSSMAQQKLVAVSIARAVWDSAVSTLAFPFTVAAMMVLYRVAVPWSGAVAAKEPEAVPAGPSTLATDGENVAATSPYRFE